MDNDCDGVVDEELEGADDDEDGYNEDEGDCNDDDDDIHPGAEELADGIDNDCDGLVDEGTDAYDDDDDGYSEQDGDCDDADPFVGPGSSEMCDDQVDNDCDGVVDEECDDEVPTDDDTTEEEGGCECESNIAGSSPRKGVALLLLGVFGLIVRRRRTLARLSVFSTIALVVAATVGLGCQDVNISQAMGHLVVAPTTADFSTVATGTSATVEVTLTNSGGARATISAMELQGRDFEMFTVDEPFTGELARSESVPIPLSFLADADGDYMALLVVTSDASNPELTVEIWGSSRDPGLHVYPSYLDFGITSVGEDEEESLYLTNDGMVDVTVLDISLDPDDAPFAIDLPPAIGDELPGLVAIGVEAEIEVTFEPVTSDPVEAELVISTNDPDNPEIVVPLYGNDCYATFHADYDGDGDGWVTCAGDCDDDNDAVYPGQVEQCDQVDEDCDGIVDEGTDCYDDDGDGWTELEGDCNDGDIIAYPGAEEIQDGIDNNCNGIVDENPLMEDDDGDGYAEGGGDCDDTDPTVYPGAEEICDLIDNDCSPYTDIDEGTDCYDDDNDGWTEDQGDCNDSNQHIYPGAPDIGAGVDWDCDGFLTGTDADGDGYTAAAGDCDDNNPNVNPGAEEVADSQDNDCDGDVDEDTVVFDDDGDGYTEVNGDCNDGDPAVYPTNTEAEDGIDNDCDGWVDEGTDNFDDDGDGYSENGGDCDDASAAMNPGAPDLTENGVDEDCDGVDGE